MKKSPLLAPLAQTFFTVLTVMIGYEVLMQWLHQDISLWESRFCTGFFSAVLATAAAYFILNKRDSLLLRLNRENGQRARTERELQGRVRELNCLYAIADFIETTDTVGALLQKAVDQIPRGLHCPEQSCARITFQDRQYLSLNFREAAVRLTAGIIVHDRPQGTVEVLRPAKTPGRGEAPFTQDERRLVDAIAERLGRFIERSQAEEMLQQAELRYRMIFEHSAMGIVIIDPPTARFLEFNETAHRQLGYTREEFARLSIPDIEAAETREETKARIETVLRDGRCDFETRQRTREGEIRHVYVRAQFIEVSGHRVYHCIWQDITESKRAEEARRVLEERLQRAEKMEALGTLAGGVAHDLNNVLGIVVGYSEMVLEEIDVSNPLRKELQKILESGKRSAAIVQDLLAMARRGVQNRQVLNINGIILNCQQNAGFDRITSLNPSIRIEMDLEEHLLNIAGSPVHLEKSLVNLVFNAAEAMPDGGLLTIATRNRYLDRPVQGYDRVQEGEYVLLSVTDTGEGVSPIDIKRIFEPFYTKKTMGKSGTGLGLAVVWGTVKDHNGYIDVQSEPGKRTTFTLYFPVTRDEPSLEKGPLPLPQYIGQGESLLVVDDVREQRELAARMLTKLNYSVATVASGEDALRYLKDSRASLVVLDMVMETGMDGLDTYRAILAIHPGQRAIIVSGFSESERVRQAQELGAGAYVRKPYVMEQLGLAVRQELDRT